MQMKTSYRALAAFVTLACSVSCISPCFSIAAFTEPDLISATDSQDPIGFLKLEHMALYPEAERLYDKESALDTIVYSNGDGTETAYIFDEPIKYCNEAGELLDKTNRLYNVSEYRDDMPEYAYAVLDNDIKTYYPSELTQDNGIIVETPITSIELSPVGEIASLTSEKDGTVEYNGAFGNFTAIKYTPTFSGYKEDLIIYEYSSNIFSFVMETNGLLPVQDESGSILLLDEKNEAYAVINPLFVYDSNEEGSNIAIDNYYEVEEVGDFTYIVNVVVDDEFLTNPETVYPVIVDPTVTVNSTGSGTSKSILDTPIYNGSGVTGKTAGGNSSAVLGYVSGTYGSGRLLMRFPGLANQSFWNNNYTISSATLTLTEGTGLSASSLIGIYNYTGESWDESSVYSSSRWNGVGSLINSQSYSYPDNTIKSFNITSAINDWLNNSTSFNRGLILKNNTSETDASLKKGIHTTESTVKPYLTVTYHPISPHTIEDGIYYIKNKHSGKYLQIKDGGTSNYSQVVQYSYHGDKYQQFKVTYESDGYYSLRPMHISNQTKTLDLQSTSNSNTNGTDCQLYTYSPIHQEQKFIINSAVGGGYQIGTKLSDGNKVLEVTNSSNAENAIVQIWAYSDTRTNDNWIFEKAFGCAWGFNAKGNGYQTSYRYINCYLYALGETEYDPLHYTLSMGYGDNVETIAARVLIDVANRNRSIRIIDGPYGHINDNEYRFCMRVGNQYIADFGQNIYDYHFWLQTETGEWCDKAGWYNAATLKGDVNPSNENWNLDYTVNQNPHTYTNFYDSDTIYFAITE